MPTGHQPTGLIYSDELRELTGARKSCWFGAAAGESLEQSCPTHPEGDCSWLYTQSLLRKPPPSEAQITPCSSFRVC